jgi:pilus assembly protein Flp/PilA
MKTINQNQLGQGLVEYLIIVALVAVGGISIMQIVGQSINMKFAQIAKSLGARTTGKIENAEVTQTSINKKNFRNFMNGALKDSSSSDSSSENDN